jgi:hypothetical protein
MFTVAGQLKFPADSKHCTLGASHGPHRSLDGKLKWNLSLHSDSIVSPFVSPEEHVPRLDKLSAAIHCQYLTFDVEDWKELSGNTFSLSSEDLGHAGFRIEQWEELTRLKLSFGQIQQARIQTFAEGSGRVESAPDYFNTEEVDFRIETWVNFLGIGTFVPLNAGEPRTYAEASLKKSLPRYVYSAPIIREIKNEDGQVFLTEVFHPPKY